MSDVICTKRKCLENKNGICQARTTYYDGLYQTYITAKTLKDNHGWLSRVGRALKNATKEVLK